MLSYFVCDQVSADPEDPSNYYNDANWCDPEYDKLYAQQNVELDPAKRKQIVHDMLTRFYKSGVYDALWYEGDLQAYRTDRFQGWLKQPADIGPVLFSNTSPTYPNLTLVGGGLSTGAIIGIVAAAIAGAALILVFVRRRGTAEERE
jgi:peptide/nickel transport system substrate-binding protein